MNLIYKYCPPNRNKEKAVDNNHRNRPANLPKMIEYGFINIGWKSCRVFEDIYVKYCLKCNRYGYKKQECTEETTCKKCVGNHYHWDCTSDISSCINCKYSNEKYRTTYDTKHEAVSERCDIHINKIKKV